MDSPPSTQDLLPGNKVFIVNLVSRKELNGEVGTIKSVLDNGRVLVSIKNQDKELSIKIENTRLYKTVAQQVFEESHPSNPFQSLAKCLMQFAISTISGLESAMYKGFSKEELQKGHNWAAPKLLINYLNDSFKSLILQSNEYICDSFQQMKSFHHHSEICLMHLILNVCVMMLQSVDFSKADLSSYQAYMTSMSLQYELIGFRMLPVLEEQLNHDCHGEGLETCDPNEPLFIVNNDANNSPQCTHSHFQIHHK